MHTRLCRRERVLSGAIPEGYSIGKSVSDGNCLYGAICVCIFGSLGSSEILSLRLHSVVHATEHFEEYVSKVRHSIEKIEGLHFEVLC